ncbi:MAG: NosD domain-containing protein [Methanolobus sp.]|nr:NosD domain-containing protein [Methanolobus sp.]
MNQISGILLDNITNSLIQNNIISDVHDGLALNASSENCIENNTLLSNTFHGIYLINSTSNDLRNNLIINNKCGLYLDLSDQNTVVNNNATENENYGVALRKSNTNNITNNQFFVNKYGLCLIDSHDNAILDNFASSNKQHGFLLWKSESNDITNNILIENENSGVYIQSSCSNNTLDGNTLSNNGNGISIENANNNLIINNTLSSNEEYGIFHLFPCNDNIIRENLFLNNKKGDENLTSFSKLIYTILIILTVTGITYYFNIALLKKALTGLGILAVISFIIIVAWYFPFESANPENNVDITNFSWYNSSAVNQIHTKVTLSMDINYRNKQAYTNNFAKNPQTNIIPVRIQISLSEYASDGITEGSPIQLYEEVMNLTYQKQFKYEINLELDNRMKHKIQTIIVFKEEYDYPHPYYGESKWEQIGRAVTVIDLNDDFSGTSK